MLSLLALSLTAYVQAFPKETTNPTCRMFTYQTSVQPTDEGVAIQFEPSLGYVRQLIDVDAHFNVSCGQFYRYAEDHPMSWRKGHYVTDLKKDTLLQHCTEQSDYVGHFESDGAIKISNKDDKVFTTFFALELEPYEEYTLEMSETPCQESKSKPVSTTTAIANDRGEIYQVSEIKMPKEKESKDKEKKVMFGRLTDSNKTVLECAELKPEMPDATLFYAFKYILEDGSGNEVVCNTRVFEISDKGLWEPQAEKMSNQPGQAPQMMARRTPDPVAMTPQMQSTQMPMERSRADSPMRMGQSPGQPSSQMRRTQPNSMMQPNAMANTQDTTGNNVRTVKEGESCSTLYGRMCEQGLNCVFASTTNGISQPNPQGVCQQRAVYSPVNQQSLRGNMPVNQQSLPTGNTQQAPRARRSFQPSPETPAWARNNPAIQTTNEERQPRRRGNPQMPGQMSAPQAGQMSGGPPRLF